MFRIAIVLFVIAAFLLLLPLGMAAVKKMKKSYETMGDEGERHTEESKSDDNFE